MEQKGKVKKKGQEEFNLPQFPALSACVVLDARFSSRQDIIKDLKASLLFEDIIEAKSLDDAVYLLIHRQPDACFVGPTISPDKAIEFIRDGKKKIHTGDCAFVAIIEENPLMRDNLLANGAHEVIERPCSKYTFTMGVIAAIIRANAGHPWSKMATSLGLDLDSLTNLGSVKIQADKPVSDELLPGSVIVKDQIAEDPTIGIGIPAALAGSQSISADIGKIFSSLDVSDLGADLHGTPSLETTEKVKGIIDTILPGKPSDPESADLRLFLEVQIVQWLIDQRTVSREMATQNLKRKLTIFLQNQR